MRGSRRLLSPMSNLAACNSPCRLVATSELVINRLYLSPLPPLDPTFPHQRTLTFVRDHGPPLLWHFLRIPISASMLLSRSIRLPPTSLPSLSFLRPSRFFSNSRPRLIIEMGTVNTTERLSQLRQLMKEHKVDVYSMLLSLPFQFWKFFTRGLC